MFIEVDTGPTELLLAYARYPNDVTIGKMYAWYEEVGYITEKQSAYLKRRLAARQEDNRRMVDGILDQSGGDYSPQERINHINGRIRNGARQETVWVDEGCRNIERLSRETFDHWARIYGISPEQFREIDDRIGCVIPTARGNSTTPSSYWD